MMISLRENGAGPQTNEDLARKRLVDGDTDGSAEQYILYLNSTPETQTPERDEAKKFLHDQFNMVWPESAA